MSPAATPVVGMSRSSWCLEQLAAHRAQYTGKVATAGVLNSIEHTYLLPSLGDASATSNGNIDPLLYW